MEPLLSVIIPVYKVETFLERCINSVIDQSYNNLEIILVDDGSPDNCPQICEKYALKDKRVKVIHKENGGQSSARNVGIDNAMGEYLTFVDSDDYLELDAYELLVREAVRNQLDIIGGGYRYYRPWKREESSKMLEGEYDGNLEILTNVEALHKLYFGEAMFVPITIMVWNKIYKRSLFEDLKFKEGYILEDTEFTPKVLHRAKRIGSLNRLVYTYNIHLGIDSTSGMGASYKKIYSGIKMSESVKEYFEKNFIPNISNKIKRMYFGGLFNAYFECTNNRKSDSEWRQLRKEVYSILIENKEEIKQINSSLQSKIFFINPWFFYYSKLLFQKSKRAKYNLYKFLTGKN